MFNIKVNLILIMLLVTSTDEMFGEVMFFYNNEE